MGDPVARGEQAARQLVAWALDSTRPPGAVAKGLDIIEAARDYLTRYLERAEDDGDGADNHPK